MMDFFFVFNNLFYCVANSQKKTLPDLVHEFDDILSKLRTKRKNRLPQLQFFKFSHICRENVKVRQKSKFRKI